MDTKANKLLSAPMNADLVWQVATSQMSNARQVLAHAKTRSEVRGGGRKPWRQKGTGKARHGSIRSPIWIGGGAAHGPSKDVNFKKKVTKMMARRALAAVLSARAAEGTLMIVPTFTLASGKTKDAVAAIATLAKKFTGYTSGRILLVLAGGPDDRAVVRATANIQSVQAVRAQDLNALTVLGFPYIIATADALAMAEKTFIK